MFRGTSTKCYVFPRRQIRRLLGLGSWTEQGVTTPASALSTEYLQEEIAGEVQVAEVLPSPSCESVQDNGVPQNATKQRGRKRQWVSDTFQTLLESVGAGGETADGSANTAAVTDKVSNAVVGEGEGGCRGSDRETAQELERLLGEVSSCEGKLLDLSSSIPDEDRSDGEDPATRCFFYVPAPLLRRSATFFPFCVF